MKLHVEVEGMYFHVPNESLITGTCMYPVLRVVLVCMYLPEGMNVCEGRDEAMASGGVILETKKQPETVLLKYFYFPTEILSRCHVHPYLQLWYM